jgi:hypothetical protein
MSLKLIILSQICTAFYVFFLGRHDVPAVDNFTFYGSDPKHQSMFHGSGFISKAFYLIHLWITLYFLTNNLKLSSLLVGCSAILIWAIFDPVIAIFRTVYTPPRKPWYYLSSKSNVIDEALVKLLGARAGLYKFWFCLIDLAVLNYFLVK